MRMAVYLTKVYNRILRPGEARRRDEPCRNPSN